jgi:hypothetical protein
MKRILPVVFCLFAMPLMASHIVGGEFEIVHVSGNQYRVSLILYFDELNGNPGAKDNNFTTAIFRKRDNVLMQNVFFSSYDISNVDYTQPECSNGEIVVTTIRMVITSFGNAAAGTTLLRISIVMTRLWVTDQLDRHFIWSSLR